MARILIVAGGSRGRRLAEAMVDEGHAVRVTTRSEGTRAAIEATGAECWIGTPARLATLRGALENVTILCWLMSGAAGSSQELTALHTSRLEFFLMQAVDTTVRGFVYEARGDGSNAELLHDGERIVRSLTERNAIPVAFLTVDPENAEGWLQDASAAIAALLGGA